MRVLVEGRRSPKCNSSAGRQADEPTVAVQSFLREVGVRALQSVPRPLPWRTTAEVVPYLARFGYDALDHETWKVGLKDADAHPTLSFRVAQYFEAARHTWYIVESRVSVESADEGSGG